MRTKIALATLALLLATANGHAEDNRACILKATEALPRISGLVVKKTRTRPVSPGDHGDLAGADAARHGGRRYHRGGRRGNLFLYLRADQQDGVRAPGHELALIIVVPAFARTTLELARPQAAPLR